jgi:hypothetical protein
MGILIVALRLLVGAILPETRCTHGLPWKRCQSCRESALRDPFGRR